MAERQGEEFREDLRGPGARNARARRLLLRDRGALEGADVRDVQHTWARVFAPRRRPAHA